MPSNFTENYSLSQWERTDRVLMEDFNADNAKIDAALKAEADARTAADAAINQTLSKKGNCTVGVFTYRGTGVYGKDNPTRITFPRTPAFFIVFGESMLVGRGGAQLALAFFNTSSMSHVMGRKITWSGNTLSYTASSTSEQLSQSDITYTVIALYAES